jgi:hypothetical protein
MSKKRQLNRQRNETGKPPAGRGFLFVAVGVGIVALVVLALRASRSPGNNPTLPTEQSGTNAVAAAAESRPVFQKLVGKWVRPDGGYIIDIKVADNAGKLEVGYFNPNPIHVARAEASGQGSMIKVFIELRDVNYPGSTYTLAYDPASDELKGIYFQAVEQQQFEVFFQRMK